MKKIIVSLHTTLDGFVAGPNGEMDWIKFDDELFGLVGKLTAEADTAIYGRVTYQWMNSYWPTAAQQPNASKHDIEHSKWYNNAHKVVLSTTMERTAADKTTVIGEDSAAQIEQLKNQTGKNMILFGSPTAAHSLMEHNLIDEYWLFINPVLLGRGIPLFSRIKDQIPLRLVTSHVFSCGVTALNYITLR